MSAPTAPTSPSSRETDTKPRSTSDAIAASATANDMQWHGKDDTSVPSPTADAVPNNSSAPDSKERHATTPLPTQDAAAHDEDDDGSPARPRGARLALLMLALCTAVFLAALDAVITSIALPSMARDLGASDAEYGWVGTAYLVANAATVPVWGKASDVWGRKGVLLGANVVFFVGCVVCGVAQSVAALLAGRVVQGVGGGGLIVLVNISISDLFSPRERPAYLALVGGTWALASCIGPILGGVFAERASWRWCFYFNLPCDGIAFGLLILFFTVHNPHTPLRAGLLAVDWAGALTIIAATVIFLVGLALGGVSYAWSSGVVVSLIVVGALLFPLFFYLQWRPVFARAAITPIIPTRVFFGSAQNACILLLCFAHGMATMSVPYFFPVYCQVVLGASPITTAVWSLALALPMVVVILGSGILVRRTGRYKLLIQASAAVNALGFGLLILLPTTVDLTRLVLFQIVLALGLAPLYQALVVALQASVEQDAMAAATGAVAFTRLLAGGVSVVVGQVILQARIQARAGEVVAAVLQSQAGAGAAEALSQLIQGGGTIGAFAEIAKLPRGAREVVLDVVNDAMHAMWIFYTAVSVVGFLASFGLRDAKLSEVLQQQKTGLVKGERTEEKRVEAERAAEV